MIKKCLPEKLIAGLGRETEMNPVPCLAVEPYLQPKA